MNSNGDRLDRIESAIEQLINLQQNQLQINDGVQFQISAIQSQISQLAERQSITDEQIRTTSAGLEQLERTVDYLMRRDQRGET